MITDDVRDRLLKQLQNRVHTLFQEKRAGDSTYHFCHPMQNRFRQEKEKEIEECNDLIKIIMGAS